MFVVIYVSKTVFLVVFFTPLARTQSSQLRPEEKVQVVRSVFQAALRNQKTTTASL